MIDVERITNRLLWLVGLEETCKAGRQYYDWKHGNDDQDRNRFTQNEVNLMKEEADRCTRLSIIPGDLGDVYEVGATFKQCLEDNSEVYALADRYKVLLLKYNNTKRSYKEHKQLMKTLTQPRLKQLGNGSRVALKQSKETAFVAMNVAGDALNTFCDDAVEMLTDIVYSLEEQKKAKIAQRLSGHASIGQYEPPTYEHACVFWMCQPVLVKLTLALE
jgi:hypothetical protein